MAWRLSLDFSDGETYEYDEEFATKADAKREYYDAFDGWSAGRDYVGSDARIIGYDIWKE